MKWINAQNTEPEESGRYLAVSTGGYCTVLEFSKRHHAWNASDKEDVAETAIDVQWWMEVPEVPVLPKEDWDFKKDEDFVYRALEARA